MSLFQGTLEWIVKQIQSTPETTLESWGSEPGPINRPLNSLRMPWLDRHCECNQGDSGKALIPADNFFGLLTTSRGLELQPAPQVS